MVSLTVEMGTLDLRKADQVPATGRHVDNLQGLLKGTRTPAWDPGPIDGSAGPRTKAAVELFQAGNGLVQDAIVGPRTWAKLIPFPQSSCIPPASPAPGPGEMAIKVFFTCAPDGDQSPPVGLTRVVPHAVTVLRTALEQLLMGPNAAEQAAGYVSLFSPATAAMLNTVELEAGGRAVVDFADLRAVIPNASASAAAHALLAQLDATVFQFPTVLSVQYRIDGSCDDFFNWLQFSCHDRTR